MNQSVPPKHFNKLVEMNPNISYAINTLIAEYDIQRCHPTCMYFLKGKEFYDQLMKMPKFDSNVLIGKMMKEDLTLSDKIGNLKLKFFFFFPLFFFLLSFFLFSFFFSFSSFFIFFLY